MKKNRFKFAFPGFLLLVSVTLTSGCVSTRRFQSGFHMGLGMMAAQTAVNTAVGIVSGMVGGGSTTVGSRSRVCGTASPYEEAYAREAARIERRRYQRWVRTQQARGAMDARMDYGYR